MCPIAQADGHDCPRLVDEAVPGKAAVIDDVVIGLEDAVGEPVVADELPDVFDRVELGRLRRQRHQGDIVGDDELGRKVPAGVIERVRHGESYSPRLGNPYVSLVQGDWYKLPTATNLVMLSAIREGFESGARFSIRDGTIYLACRTWLPSPESAGSG